MAASVLVLGGTRGTGFAATKILRERGDAVTALVRPSSDTAALKSLGVRLVTGNAVERADIDAAFASGEISAVINTLGGKRGETPRPDLVGTEHSVAAAKAAGVQRYLLVTAIGTGDSRTAVAPNVLKFLGEVLAMKTQAEDLLTASGLDYTILRPGGMTNDPASGTAIKTQDHNVMGVINRDDLGALVVECLDDDSTIGNTYHTVDPEIKWEAPLQRGEGLGDKK